MPSVITHPLLLVSDFEFCASFGGKWPRWRLMVQGLKTNQEIWSIPPFG